MKVDIIDKPWKHFIIDDVFSKEDYQILKDFPRLDSGYENITGFRDAIDNRVYLNDKFVNDNPQFKNILRTLNNTDIFEKIFDVKLSRCSLRPELIDDRYPFFHEVHCDHPDKVLTLLIYIDKDDEQNLASDLYIDENTHHTKLKWKNNGGIGWTIEPNDNKWHGFKPMKYDGVRRILIVNWVKDEVWNDKSQLYLDWRTQPFKYNPNDWNKLDDLERNQKYADYMDWLGGVNTLGRGHFTDNVEVLTPEKNSNLYEKLKAYILLCRRYRDRNIILKEKEINGHLQNLQKLVEDNFKEIIKNLFMTKWITSILMCFMELGTEKQKQYSKKLSLLLVLNRINLYRGRTLITLDELTLKEQFSQMINFNNINELYDKLEKNTKHLKEILDVGS
mgnify:FL=1